MTGSAQYRAAAVLLILALLSAPAAAQTDEHAGHQQPKPQQPESAVPAGQHQHPASDESTRDLPAFIPPVTDEDRRAAFPDVQGHAVHDNAINYFVLVDQLEWQSGGANGLNVDTRGWVGRDRDRLWFRGEGARAGGRVEHAQAHVLYGRQIARWWDVVAGVRQDFRPGTAQTWAAVGVHGLAPYRVDVELTGYIGAAGRTHARVEVKYELLVTNRLILQPLFEVDIVGKSDAARRIGAGVSTTDLGFRLRYEFRRELAPYVGVTWSNAWGKTADFADAAGEDRRGARFVGGLRLWF